MSKKIKVFIVGDIEIVNEFKRLTPHYCGTIEYVLEEKDANAIIDISDYNGTTSLTEEVKTAIKGIEKIQKVKKTIRKINHFTKLKNGSK